MAHLTSRGLVHADASRPDPARAWTATGVASTSTTSSPRPLPEGGNSETSSPLLSPARLGSGSCSVCAVGWAPPPLPLAVARRCPRPTTSAPSTHLPPPFIYAPARRPQPRAAPPTFPAPPLADRRRTCLLAFLLGWWQIEAGSGAARLDPGAQWPRRRRGPSPACAAASGSRPPFCFAYADAEQLHQHDLFGR